MCNCRETKINSNLKIVSGILLFLAVMSCSDNRSKQDEFALLKAQVDSMKAVVDSINNNRERELKDSMNTGTNAIEFLRTDTGSKYLLQRPLQNPITEKKMLNPSVTTVDDTTRHYYQNSKRISIKISPWNNGKRTLSFYDPFGKSCYEINDVRLSYSEVTQIKKFHSNGAVDVIERSINPGASLYHYQEKITFDTDNQPLWKQTSTHPAESPEDQPENFWWDKKSHTWRKQETVEEQPVPRD